MQLRFSGRLKRTQAMRRHILQKKSSKRKRQLAVPALVDKTEIKKIKECLPFG